MSRVLSVKLGLLFLVPLAVSSAARAQALDTPGAVRSAVLDKYHITQATADDTDIVTAGDVITLLKSGLVMYGVDHAIAKTGAVSYHDGKLNAGGMTRLMTFGSSQSNVATHTFVSGEKCWLVAVNIKDDGLYLQFLSDPIGDARYMGSIKFPFDKKQPMPSADVVMARVGEVISATPMDQPNQPPANSAAAAPPPAAIAPIAPPPPPPDEPAAPPPTISLGQTKATVQASFGQPTRVVKLGTKEIEYFNDMKVTFVNGKVTDVQ